MDVKQVLADSAKKHLLPAAKAMAVELVAEAAIPALEEAVKKTSTPIDDVVLAALKEPLKAALIELIQKA
jgi:hypothetical protein